MPEPLHRPTATFQPRFTLSLLYFFVLFLAYCMLLVAPELAEVARPAGPADEEALRAAAYEAAREALGPRLPIAVVAALATLALGARARLLPGLRPK